jgi:nuclear inhibitor of protein phosphatase 1
VKGDEKMGGEDDELKGLLGLPEEETELDVSLCHCLLGSLL